MNLGQAERRKVNKIGVIVILIIAVGFAFISYFAFAEGNVYMATLSMIGFAEHLVIALLLLRLVSKL